MPPATYLRNLRFRFADKKNLVPREDTELEFTDTALALLAQRAHKRDTGARALRTVMEEVMLDLMYELPEQAGKGAKYIIDAEAIEERFTLAAAYLGIEGGFAGFQAFVDGFNDSLGVPKTLTELGVTNPDIDALTRSALADPSCGGNPISMTEENTRALIESLI